jgi:hypothetical protein
MQKTLMAIAAVALLIGGSSAVARTEGVDIMKDGFKDTTRVQSSRRTRTSR